ncbi:MAG: hypothetical protein C0631_01820 [Sedimenticola sp.]|nr:MAG: hypothetical protein C0631_01820 [Sedimenticola sp.]
MDGLHLLRPAWLLALLPLLLFLWVRFKYHRESSRWLRVLDAHLLPHLLIDIPTRARLRPLLLMSLFWTLLMLALAGPSWQRLPPVSLQPDVPPLALVLDLSRSMESEDLAPSRLAVAKAKLRALVSELSQRPIALMVYTLKAHSVMPFTEDRKLIASLLQGLTPEMMPVQGSAASAGLQFAEQQFAPLGGKGGDLLLITDGVDEATGEQAARLAERGIRVSVYALASREGGYIPDQERGYLYAEAGPVRTALDLPALQQVARQGQGFLQQATRDNSDIQALIKGLGSVEIGDLQLQETAAGAVWREGGPWLILLALPLALWLYRSAAMLALLLGVGLISPPAEAFEWDLLWRNAGQRARVDLDNNRFSQAASGFADPLWRGIAEYRDGRYQAALHSFSRDDSLLGHFNRGNALVQLGRYQQALAAYQEVLSRSPGHPDALYNYQLVRKLLRRQSIPDAAQSAPAVAEQTPPVREGERQSATRAEDQLDAPTQEDLRPRPAAEVAPELSAIGQVGGGAMLLEGASHPETDQGNSVGEGLVQADQAGGSQDQIARQGSGEGAGESGVQERSLAQTQALERGDRVQAPEPRQATEPVATAQRDATNSQGAGGKDDANSEGADTSASGSQSDGRAPGESAEAGASQGQDGQPGSEQSQSKEAAQISATQDPSAVAAEAGYAGQIALDAEQLQAMRHWLDSIEDDATGLLREKFRRELLRDPGVQRGMQAW